MRVADDLAAATAFLTRVPAGRLAAFDREAVTRAAPLFPLLPQARRGLLGHGSPGVLGGIPDGVVMLFLLVSTAVAVPVALATFAWFMRRARQAGLLDMVTGS